VPPEPATHLELVEGDVLDPMCAVQTRQLEGLTVSRVEGVQSGGLNREENENAG